MSIDDIREIVEQAHMAGQVEAGIDPSYSNARLYFDSLNTNHDEPEIIEGTNDALDKLTIFK